VSAGMKKKPAAERDRERRKTCRTCAGGLLQDQ